MLHLCLARSDLRALGFDFLIRILLSIVEALDVDYEGFYDVVNIKIWASVGRANPRPFNEARSSFVNWV